MKNIGKSICIVVSVSLLAMLTCWGWIERPWENKVSISTTRDAFVGPRPGSALISNSQSGTLLKIGITPAPWPSEAKLIWDQASRGRRVHITIRDPQRRISFDIVGVSIDGDLLVPCHSSNDAEQLVEKLGIRVN
jgi:hypothetical protein